MKSVEDRLDTLLERTDEAVTREELEALLEEEKTPSSYIGFAPTGTLHVGHLLTLNKIPDFQEAGIQNTVLVADEHALIDAEKTDEELIDARSEYYEEGLKAIIDSLGGETQEIDFKRGSEFQFEKEYLRAIRRMKYNTTANRMERALGDVVARNDDGEWNASVYDYPPMQSQDAAALGADIAYSGGDQRSLYMYAREALPEEDKPIWISAPMLSGLSGGKMSSSREDSKISIHDTEDEIYEKVNGAEIVPGQIEDNGVLEFAKHLVYPKLEQEDREFTIERPEEYGGNVSFSDYQALEDAYREEELHPEDLKQGVAKEINVIIEPIREEFKDENLLREAYPDQF